MSFEFHEFLLRVSGSLEVATIVAATAVVSLRVIRHALLRQTHGRPDLEVELRQAFVTRSHVVAAAAGVLIILAFAFDLRGQLFAAPSDGMHVSAAAFLFVVCRFGHRIASGRLQDSCSRG